MIEQLERLDALVYAVEKRVVATMLAVMGAVVFLDVVYRVTATTESPIVPDALEAALGPASVPLWAGIVNAAIGVLAFRTRAEGGALWKGAVWGLLSGVGLYAYVTLMPNGMVWSQTLALSLTLWMGMAGASLAAYQRRHLALDVGSKVWPAALAPKVAALGHGVTAAFCVLIAVLGWRSIFGVGEGEAHIPGHWDTWAGSEHAAGTMTGTVIPKWMVMFSIPFGAAVLAFRFGLEGARVWLGREALGGDDTLHQLGLDADGSPS